MQSKGGTHKFAAIWCYFAAGVMEGREEEKQLQQGLKPAVVIIL